MENCKTCNSDVAELVEATKECPLCASNTIAQLRQDLVDLTEQLCRTDKLNGEIIAAKDANLAAYREQLKLTHEIQESQDANITKLAEALENILDQIPPNAKLPLTLIIKEIATDAITGTEQSSRWVTVTPETMPPMEGKMRISKLCLIECDNGSLYTGVLMAGNWYKLKDMQCLDVRTALQVKRYQLLLI